MNYSYKYLSERCSALRIRMVCAAAILLPMTTYGQDNFTDVAKNQNITHRYNVGSIGGGVSFVDFNGDGWDDLTFSTSEGEKLEFYQNVEGQFQKVDLGIDNTCQSKQVAWIDFDNDGDKDLFYNCTFANVKLYRNEGNMVMTDVTDAVGLSASLGLPYGANWADFDRDGFLDLYLSFYDSGTPNQLFRNVGGNSFTDISVESQTTAPGKLTFCAQIFDYDHDGWPDIYIANDRETGNNLFRNFNGTLFEDISAFSKTDVRMDAMGVTILDMNYDGEFELYLSNTQVGNVLLFNNGDGTYKDIAEESGALFSSFGWGVNALDFNNDRRSDLYVSGSDLGTDVLSSALYQAVSEENFVLTQFSGMVTDTLSSISNAVGDFNRDGLMDIVVNNTASINSQLWRNECPPENLWLNVELEGMLSNKDGIGTTLALYTGDKVLYQYTTSTVGFMGQNADYVHFGLENVTTPDSLLIHWPSGVVDKIVSPAANQKIKVSEGQHHKPVTVTSAFDLTTTMCNLNMVDLHVEIYGQNISVDWSNGMTGSDIVITESGTYNAEIKSNGVILQSETVDIVFGDLPQVEVQVTPIEDERLGSVQINSTGGPYTYRWSHDPEETASSVNNLPEGDYAVTITNDQGCTSIREFTIEVVTAIPEELKAEISVKYTGETVIVELPELLKQKLKSWRVYSFDGQIITKSQNTPQLDGDLIINGIRSNRLVFIDLIFTDGRIVKKHISLN